MAARAWVKRLGCLIAIVSVTWLSIGSVPVWGQVQPFGRAGSMQLSNEQILGKETSYKELLPAFQQADSMRVIVRLNLNFIPEGILGNVASQRASIAGAQERVIKRTQSAGLEEYVRRFETIPVVVLEVDAEGLRALKDNPEVVSIREDRLIPPALADSVAHIDADLAWAMGYSGSGQVVAILDTGVQTTHPAFSGRIVDEACFSTTYAAHRARSLCPAGVNPGGSDSQVGRGAGVNCDPAIYGCNHGTHVAGIAAGNGGGVVGVARDAGVLPVQVFSEFSGTICMNYARSAAPCVLSYISDVLAAMEHIYSLRDSYSIAAVNMSMGGGRFSATCDDAETEMKAIIDNLASAGIAVVVSSGNNSYTNALGSPACISSAVSVGSSSLADAVSTFSNVAGFLDFLAPGQSILSAVPGNGMETMSGTSMAAPHVTGAWALLKSAVPGSTFDQVYQALAMTGVLIKDTRSGATAAGIPRVDVDNAIAYLMHTIEPTPTAVFADVDPDTPYYAEINALHAGGYVTGCQTEPERLYCPAAELSRAESAVFVERGVYGGGYDPPASVEVIFGDVPTAAWYTDWVNALWVDGYTAGCEAEPLRYCPEVTHTRAQGTVFFLRMMNGPAYRPPTAKNTVFYDVQPGEWYCDWVYAAYEAGIAPACQTEPELLFCPEDALSRAVAAYMMVQAKGGLPLPTPQP